MLSGSFIFRAVAVTALSLLVGFVSVLGLYAVACFGGVGSLTGSGVGIAYSNLLTGTVSVSGLLVHNAPFLIVGLLIAAVITRHGAYRQSGEFFVEGSGEDACVVEESTEKVGPLARALAYLALFGALVIVTTGSTVAAVANGARMAPHDVMTSLVHGPLEFGAFGAPFAALLLCSHRAHRPHLRQTLALACAVGAVLLIAGAVVETHVTPGLLRDAFDTSPIVRGT